MTGKRHGRRGITLEASIAVAPVRDTNESLQYIVWFFILVHHKGSIGHMTALLRKGDISPKGILDAIEAHDPALRRRLRTHLTSEESRLSFIRGVLDFHKNDQSGARITSGAWSSAKVPALQQ